MGSYSPSGEFDAITAEDLSIPEESDLAGVSARDMLETLISDVKTQPGSFVWVGLVNPTKPELALVAELFALEPLEIRDAGNTAQRPKFDLGENQSFALLKTISYNLDSKEIKIGQTSVFVGRDYAITVRFGSPGDLTSVRQRMAASKRLRTHGPMAVLYAVLDITVDSYLAVAEEINEDMREIEQVVFSMQPTANVTNSAQRFVTDSERGVPKELEPFFADVGEHILRVHDTVDTIDNSLLTMLMASTALLDLKQNSDMRKISAWVAIAAVPTVTAGIYGMNFEDMPELKWSFGYPVVLGFMAITCLLLYRGFKKSGWL
jgi:magnesium transporter